MHAHFALLTTVMTSCIAISACGKGSLAELDNIEIAAKHDECVRKAPTSPGRVTACENIRKECESRRKKGNYAC
ncbi:hypothetical protein [Marinagarivorans algicola]|uniref:hypothetical protein n=1 Tax=Marinagarivorans algicola TaxID=1513270 RepID=UPI0006B6148C|nr:hypothetical protein [Marinagarivorans algicola]